MEDASCDTKCKKNDEGEILMNKIMDTKNKSCHLGKGDNKKINKIFIRSYNYVI